MHFTITTRIWYMRAHNNSGQVNAIQCLYHKAMRPVTDRNVDFRHVQSAVTPYGFPLIAINIYICRVKIRFQNVVINRLLLVRNYRWQRTCITLVCRFLFTLSSYVLHYLALNLHLKVK